MADFKIAINLTANDHASSVIRNLTAQVKGLNRASSRATGSGAGTGSSANGGRGRRGRGKDASIFGGPTAGELHAAANAVGDFGRRVGQVGLVAPIQLASNFEAAINRVNALSGGKFAVTGELENISKKSRELGKATEFTATEVAQGFQILTQAGFKYEEQLDAITHVLNFSTIGQVDMATSADLLSNALGGFGLKASETERVANAMTRASLASQIELSHLGESFKYAAPQAAQLGFNVEQVSTALAVMGKAGVRGSMGGTALRAFFNRLATATGPLASDKQKAAMKMLGIDSKALKAAIESGDLASVPKLLADSIGKKKGLSKARMIAALQGLFTERGGLGAAILIRSVQKDTSALSEAEKQMFAAAELDPSKIDTGKFATVWDDVEAAMNDGGVTMEKTAGEIRTGTKNSMTVLNSAMEELGITIGEKLLPLLNPLLDKAIALTGAISDWANKSPESVVMLAKVAAGLAAAGLVLSPLITGFATLRTLMKLGSLVTGWTAAMNLVGGGAASAAGKVGLLNAAHGILGAFVAGYTLGTLADQYWGISDAIAGVNQQVSVMNGMLGFDKRSPVSFLSNLTGDEQSELDQRKANLERLAQEKEDAPTNWTSPMADMIHADIDKRIMAEKAAIDAINNKGIKRGEQLAAMDKTRTDLDAAIKEIQIRVKVDRDNRFLGIEAEDAAIEQMLAGAQTEGR